LVLNLICLFYYNLPIHSPNSDKTTDYVWQPEKWYMQMSEGIGFGKTNNEGYLDIDDYQGEKIDVLIMGSSHLQGFPIPQKQNMSALLQEKLGKNVYNISIAGHNLKVCISNLEDALNKYHPSVVVIETNRLSFTTNEIDAVLNGSIPDIPSSNTGIVAFLQKSPFLRIAYSQFESFISKRSETSSQNKQMADPDKIKELLEYIETIALENHCKVILLYHPAIELQQDGTLLVDTDEQLPIWNLLCEENDISFLDMSERYKMEYEIDGILPTGFINTSVATGHINAYGHAMMADELYRILIGD